MVCNLTRLRCGWAELQLDWTMKSSKWVYLKAGPFGCDSPYSESCFCTSLHFPVCH